MGAEQITTTTTTTTKTTRSLIFTYGTLKQGFANHNLLNDFISTGDASFLGAYSTLDPLPLVCGPYNVPFLLNLPGLGHRVTGELYAVSDRALSRIDELEGTSRGHYQRLPLKVEAVDGGGAVAVVEAYFAHWSYAEKMWKRSGEKGLRSFTAEEVKGYVKRKDRPQNVSFLDQIRVFLSSD